MVWTPSTPSSSPSLTSAPVPFDTTKFEQELGELKTDIITTWYDKLTTTEKDDHETEIKAALAAAEAADLARLEKIYSDTMSWLSWITASEINALWWAIFKWLKESWSIFAAWDAVINSVGEMFGMNSDEIEDGAKQEELKGKDLMIMSAPFFPKLAAIGRKWFGDNPWAEKTVDFVTKNFLWEKKWWFTWLLSAIDSRAKGFMNRIALQNPWNKDKTVPYPEVVAWYKASTWPAYTPSKIDAHESLAEADRDVLAGKYPSTTSPTKIREKLGLDNKYEIDATITGSWNATKYINERKELAKRIESETNVNYAITIAEDIYFSKYGTNSHATKWKNPFLIQDTSSDTWEWVSYGWNYPNDQLAATNWTFQWFKRAEQSYLAKEEALKNSKSGVSGVDTDDRVAQVKKLYPDGKLQDAIIATVNGTGLVKQYDDAAGAYKAVAAPTPTAPASPTWT